MDQRGWVPATAGNISVRLDTARIAITRSGGHKGFLDSFSVMEIGLDGLAMNQADRPSAEARLHSQIYRAFPEAGAVLHGHSIANTVLSLETEATCLSFTGYEVQKIFAGQTTHLATLTMPLVDNDQDMERLAAAIAPHLPHATMGYLIRGHGIYIWGPDMDVALARLEGAEFLLACTLERRRR